MKSIRNRIFLYKEILAEVNDMRVSYGAKPLRFLPRGYRVDAVGCVLYNAFRDCGINAVGPDALHFVHSVHRPPHHTSAIMKYFVTSYDMGEFWFLEKPRGPMRRTYEAEKAMEMHLDKFKDLQEQDRYDQVMELNKMLALPAHEKKDEVLV